MWGELEMRLEEFEMENPGSGSFQGKGEIVVKFKFISGLCNIFYFLGCC